jgi:amino acid permease
VNGLEQRRIRRTGRRRLRWLKLLALAVGVLVAFGLGIGLGQALDDGPPTGATQTFVRTLQPLPQRPADTTGP